MIWLFERERERQRAHTCLISRMHWDKLFGLWAIAGAEIPGHCTIFHFSHKRLFKYQPHNSKSSGVARKDNGDNASWFCMGIFSDMKNVLKTPIYLPKGIPRKISGRRIPENKTQDFPICGLSLELPKYIRDYSISLYLFNVLDASLWNSSIPERPLYFPPRCLHFFIYLAKTYSLRIGRK